LVQRPPYHSPLIPGTSMSNRSKKRLRPARFGKCLGLSLTKKWRVPVIVPVSDSLRGCTRLPIVPTVLFVASLSARHSARALIAGAAFILMISVFRSLLGDYEQWGRKVNASWLQRGGRDHSGPHRGSSRPEKVCDPATRWKFPGPYTKNDRIFTNQPRISTDQWVSDFSHFGGPFERASQTTIVMPRSVSSL